MSALTDPTNILFNLVDDASGSGMRETDAYALLAGRLTPGYAAAAGLIITAATDPPQTGGMIALVPTEVDAARLAVPGGEEPGELHVTLAYLGDDVTGLPAAVQESLVNVARRYAGDVVRSDAFAVNVFNPGTEKSCVVLGIGNAGGEQLQQLRSNVVSALGGLASFELPEQHTPWVPHLTLRYTNDLTVVDEAADKIGPVTFDRLRVALGGNIVDIALSGDVITASGDSWVDQWRAPKGSETGGQWIEQLDPGDVSSSLKRVKKAKTGGGAAKAAASIADIAKNTPLVGAAAIWYQAESTRINLPLRQGRPLSGREGAATGALDAAMAPTTGDIVTYRSIAFPRAVFGSAWSDGDNEGLTWRDDAFVSTTVDEKIAEVLVRGRTSPGTQKVLMKILVPKGSAALRVDVGQYKDEKEVLLGRGQRYRVVKDEGVRAGIHHLTVEVVPLSTPLTAATTSRTDTVDLTVTSTNEEAARAARLVDSGPLVAVEDRPLTAARERDVNAPGNTGHQLRDHWVRGPGAAEIRWGTDGSFNRCTSKLRTKVRNPEGLCAEYHKAATGEWPAEKGVESAVDMETLDVARVVANKKRGYNPDGSAKCPPGHHLMPDGSCMPDTEMSVNAEEFHGNHNQDAHGNWADQLKGMKDVTPSQLEATRKKLATPGASTRKLDVPNTGDEGIAQRRSNLGYDDDELTPDEEREADRRRVETAAAEPPTDESSSDETWDGLLVVEGIESGDSRLFNLGSLDWAAPPLPLQYQPANIGGHNGSVTVGEITHLARQKNQVFGWGTIFGNMLAGEHGDGIRNMMRVGGVSVDVDSTKDADVELIYASDEGGGPFSRPEMSIFHRGRIRGATLVAFPAFVEAKLSFTSQQLTAAAADEDDCGCELNNPLVASAHTITIPNLPPASWFNEPTDVKLNAALTITDEGRVFGLVAPANTTHRNFKNVKTPRNLDYSRFHKGETIVEGGGRVVTGIITAGCGHAPTHNYGTLDNRISHYDNSCSVLANVRVGESRNGEIWVAGALNAGASPGQVAQALGCALSLDVQPHPDRPGTREFIAAHLVPVPGFPLARANASVQLDDGALVASTIPVAIGEPEYIDTTGHDAVTLAKRALVARLGLDPVARKKSLIARVGA